MTITILITTIIVIEVIPRPDPGAPAFIYLNLTSVENDLTPVRGLRDRQIGLEPDPNGANSKTISSRSLQLE